MKANYPVEFLAASMTLDMGNTDKLAEFRAEAQRLGIKVVPPSINRSGVDLRGRRHHDLLRARRAEGRRPPGGRADHRRRAATGAFADLTDFAARVNPRAVNKRVLESLAAAGAFDALEPNRARVFAGVDAILAACQRTPRGRGGRAERHVRRRGARARPSRCRRSSRGCRPTGCSANTTPSASSCRAIRSTTTPPIAEAHEGAGRGRSSRAR